jgi:hypothetical protein
MNGVNLLVDVVDADDDGNGMNEAGRRQPASQVGTVSPWSFLTECESPLLCLLLLYLQ